MPAHCTSDLISLVFSEFLALQDTLLSGWIPLEVCSLREKELEVFTTQCPNQHEQGEQLGIICPVPICCSACT